MHKVVSMAPLLGQKQMPAPTSTAVAQQQQQQQQACCCKPFGATMEDSVKRFELDFKRYFQRGVCVNLAPSG